MNSSEKRRFPKVGKDISVGYPMHACEPVTVPIAIGMTSAPVFELVTAASAEALRNVTANS